MTYEGVQKIERVMHHLWSDRMMTHVAAALMAHQVALVHDAIPPIRDLVELRSYRLQVG
jgi:hypothetical protein